MRDSARTFCTAMLVVPAFAVLSACGYVGDPQPPSLEIPQRVQDVAVVERGNSLIVTFTAPSLTVDNIPIRRLDDIEVRVGPETGSWESDSPRVEAVPGEQGKVRAETPAAPWTGKDVIVRVRVAGRKGRFSAWSDPVRMRVVPPLEAPRDVRAEAVAEGVRVSWTAQPGSGAEYRVFRGDALAGTAAGDHFIDTATQYGQKYEYTVQAFRKTGDATEAVSEPSSVAAVTPEDRFPPAVPAGLAATAGVGAIQLNWEPNTEADLRGYRVYRSAGGGEFAPIGDILPTPNYTDRAVSSGTAYRYAVTAIDQNGNESARSAPAEATAQ